MTDPIMKLKNRDYIPRDGQTLITVTSVIVAFAFHLAVSILKSRSMSDHIATTTRDVDVS